MPPGRSLKRKDVYYVVLNMIITMLSVAQITAKNGRKNKDAFNKFCNILSYLLEHNNALVMDTNVNII